MIRNLILLLGLVMCAVAAHATEPFGDGADGPANFAVTTTINTPEAALTAPTFTGATGIPVDSVAGFVAGGEVILITFHGTGAGEYEFARIQAVGASFLILATPTTHNYFATDSHVFKVWNFTTLSVQPGAQVTPSGNVLGIRATISATIDGSLNANGQGYGGAPTSPGANGSQGYSYNGTPIQSSAANFGGGGGGVGSGTGAGGGGGGGNFPAGDTGAAASGNAGGTGGGANGVADLSKLFLGSGGGGGGHVVSGSTRGGSGGGILILSAPSIYTSSFADIASDGGDGDDADSSVLVGTGGGGSGSGGSIVLTVSNSGALFNNGFVVSWPGFEGTDIGPGTLAVGAGGSGALGRIRINGPISGSGTMFPTPSFGPGVTPPADATSWILYE